MKRKIQDIGLLPDDDKIEIKRIILSHISAPQKVSRELKKNGYSIATAELNRYYCSLIGEHHIRETMACLQLRIMGAKEYKLALLEECIKENDIPSEIKLRMVEVIDNVIADLESDYQELIKYGGV